LNWCTIIYGVSEITTGASKNIPGENNVNPGARKIIRNVSKIILDASIIIPDASKVNPKQNIPDLSKIIPMQENHPHCSHEKEGKTSPVEAKLFHAKSLLLEPNQGKAFTYYGLFSYLMPNHCCFHIHMEQYQRIPER